MSGMCEGCGRIHEAGRLGWSKSAGTAGRDPVGEDGVLKLQGALVAVGLVDLQRVGVDKAGASLHVGQLARPDELTQALRHLGYYFVLIGPQLVEVDFGRGESGCPTVRLSRAS